MERLDLCGGWRFSLNGGAWKAVTLPHDFSLDQSRTPDSPMGDGGGWFQGGVGVYRRTLELPIHRRAILVVEGCYGVAAVAVNGEVLASHPYGYSEFHVDLTGHLTGRDVLTITVDNTDLPNSRWYSGSGLYRPVWIALGGEVCLPPWSGWVTAPEIGAGRAAVEVSFSVDNLGSGRAVPLSVELLDPDGQLAARWTRTVHIPAGGAAITQRLTVNAPRLWDLDTPDLYTAIIAAGSDRQAIPFGIRRAEVGRAAGLRLNGRSLKLRGGCIHHDNGPLGACAYEEAEWRRISKLKAAGFNAVRCAHNPPSRALLDACDRLGMLVMDEAFDCWAVGKTSGGYHRYFADWWRRDLAAMVLRDRSHPSVILYSTGNEIPDRGQGPDGAALSRSLADHIRRMDPTRPVTNGVCGIFVDGGQYQGILSNLLNGAGGDPEALPPEAREALRKAGETPQDWGASTEDFISPLDVAGYNYLDFRYEMDRARFPDRTICGTESFPKLMDTVWKHTLDNDNVIGDFTWAAWDYLGESGIGRAFYDQAPVMFSPYPYHLANCGDFDICGCPRPQSRCRQVLWGVERRPFMAVLPPDLTGKKESVTAWGWPAVEESWTFPGREGSPCRVEIYSNAEQVQLWLGGTLLATAGVSGHKAVFQVIYRPGQLRAVNLRDGNPAEEAVLETAGPPARLALIPETEHLPAHSRLIYLWAEIQDARGRRVPWADCPITCAVNGCARLLGGGSGDPESTQLYTAPTHRAYHGRALFILCRNGDGPADASVTAGGLPAAVLSLSPFPPSAPSPIAFP